MSDLFYLQDSRGCVGSNVIFWKKGGNGYGTNLDELEVYTLEQAQSHHNSRESDVPLLKSLVDELSISACDHQVLPREGMRDPFDEYVVQHKGYWNGNDILFVHSDGESYDYSRASCYSRDDIERDFYDSDTYAFFSRESMDKIARKTFQSDNIDKRSMIAKAGIKLIKPKRVRPTTGKTRGNCPTCGKITWDYNPYENAYCKLHD